MLCRCDFDLNFSEHGIFKIEGVIYMGNKKHQKRREEEEINRKTRIGPDIAVESWHSPK